MSFVCEADMSEIEGANLHLKNVEGVPRVFQWHGRTAESDHLPV